MKISRVLLILSLAANVALLGMIVTRRLGVMSPDSRASPENREKIPGEKSGGAAVVSDGAGEKLPGSRAQSSPEASLWSRLETNDLELLRKHLRAAGFPYRAVRTLIFDLAQAKAEIARAAVQGKTADFPYWKTVPYFPDDPALRAKVREANEEFHQLLYKSAYDPESLEDEEMVASERWRFGNLSLEKLRQLYQVQQDYSELRNDVYKALNAAESRGMTSAEREKLAVLAAEEQRDLQKIMTPEEFSDYELRSSRTAASLRYRLSTFRPTEAEYKTLFVLQRSVDLQFNIGAGADEKMRQAADDATKALAPQIAAALGPERYADYVQAADRSLYQLNRLMVRLDLPLSTVGKIEQVRTEVSQRAEAVRSDAQLSPADRNARLAVLAQEAQTRITGTIGARGYPAYEELKGGWLRALRDPSPPR